MGMWESLLCYYGNSFPEHPAKRRTVLNLAHLGKKTWNLPRVVQRRGVTFELDLKDAIPRSIYYLGYYEPWETRWLESVLKPGWTVLGTIESPIQGGDGNKEYLIAAQKA